MFRRVSCFLEQEVVGFFFKQEYEKEWAWDGFFKCVLFLECLQVKLTEASTKEVETMIFLVILVTFDWRDAIMIGIDHVRCGLRKIAIFELNDKF